MEASPRFFVNGWKQGIWDDFLDLHTSTATKGNSSKEFELDATAMFLFIFSLVYIIKHLKAELMRINCSIGKSLSKTIMIKL